MSYLLGDICCKNHKLTFLLFLSMSFEPGTPNATSHFCAGDVTKWSGIKRCGAAMHGGHYIAYNIHQSVLKQVVADHQPKFQELQEIPPMIGLAVGKNAVAYGPDVGVVTGPEVMEAYFRNDLGWASKLCTRLPP